MEALIALLPEDQARVPRGPLIATTFPEPGTGAYRQPDADNTTPQPHTGENEEND